MRLVPALRALAVVLCGGVGSLSGCKTEPTAEAPKPCCEQPPIPSGVAPFAVAADEVAGPTDGEKVVLRVALKAPAKRDAIYPVLHTMYRYLMKRRPFEPIGVTADVYASEADARAGGDAKSIARIERAQGDLAPKCDNRVPYDFSEQVDRAFNASLGRAAEDDPSDTCRLNEKKKVTRFDDGFKLKPTYKVDPARHAVEVTYPYLVDGKDEYRSEKELKLSSALTYWIEFTTSLFSKVADLKEITYNGILNDEAVVRIVMTRPQYDTGFARLQETISAHAAVTFQSLGMGRSSDKSAEKEQDQFKKTTYKNALSHLPKGQVTLSPKLK